MQKAKKELSGTVPGFDAGYHATEILVYTWISFEAFTCLRYNLAKPSERNKAFCDEFSERYKQEYNEFPDEFKKMLIGLASYIIIDMSPGKKKPNAEIKDSRDLTQVIASVYRVRCNLFHGGKDINEITDITLVKCAGTVLYYILEKFLREEHLI